MRAVLAEGNGVRRIDDALALAAHEGNARRQLGLAAADLIRDFADPAGRRAHSSRPGFC